MEVLEPALVDTFVVTATRVQLDRLRALAGQDPDLSEWFEALELQVQASTDPEQLVCCEACGALDIQVTAWVRANSGETVDGDPPLEEVWCDTCEANVDFVQLSVFLR